ncbi:hypothetical protein TNCV_900791 [Trichonephila clavipes]|nr:hypothetical protein TNCV_900791 [Trichonephila clavipes]
MEKGKRPALDGESMRGKPWLERTGRERERKGLSPRLEWKDDERRRSLPPNYYGHLALADKRCGNSSLFINSWEGISELGPRRHKETHQQCVLFAPDPVTTARLETHNVYPDIGAHGARAGMRRNRWGRLRDNSSKEPSPIGAGKGQNIRV